MSKLKDYKYLLSQSYIDAVELLIQKYGPAQDGYYNEKSYERFLCGKIKSITRGKYTRTSEGLYCHHIDENITLNISNLGFIKANKITFKFQKKERLVFCDLIEHSILHILIMKEHPIDVTNTEEYFINRSQGYEVYLLPIIEDWYIKKQLPSREWMVNCFDKAFLNSDDTLEIINEMNKLAKIDLYPKTIDEYHIAEKLKEDKLKKEMKECINLRKKRAEKDRKILIEFSRNLNSKSSREAIIWSYYSLKYKSFCTFETYKKEVIKYTKDYILTEMNEYLANLSR